MFQLEVSENKDVICFSIQVHGPLEIYPRTPKGSVDPRLRTPALDVYMSHLMPSVGRNAILINSEPICLAVAVLTPMC
jgi:hypothetical protein